MWKPCRHCGQLFSTKNAQRQFCPDKPCRSRSCEARLQRGQRPKPKQGRPRIADRPEPADPRWWLRIADALSEILPSGYLTKRQNDLLQTLRGACIQFYQDKRKKVDRLRSQV